VIAGAEHEDGLAVEDHARALRLVSGPQGPRVILDGEPVLVLCSGNHLGLADHPRVREAAAEAAMRWGVGAGGTRLASGTMRVHRRLEERLAAFLGSEAALLFGSGYLAGTGILPALAGPGDVVLCDELNHVALDDGCRLTEAETFVYAHADVEHLAWGLEQAAGRAALVVTDGVFAVDGDVAPLEELVALAHDHDVRLLVDESQGLGALGPGGRGAVADAGLEGEVDLVVGSLGAGLGAYGAFAACEAVMARYLAAHARSFLASTALPPPVVAGALAALELLDEQPRRVEKLRANAELLRGELAREGFEVSGACTHVIPLVVGEGALALRFAEAALEEGVFAECLAPPLVPEGAARVRLTVMASHGQGELREAARALGRAALRVGFRPGAGVAAPPPTPRPAVLDRAAAMVRALPRAA
jgi:glycine C-acetyltransferase/8-amino-7-oxononanoate synthase